MNNKNIVSIHDALRQLIIKSDSLQKVMSTSCVASAPAMDLFKKPTSANTNSHENGENYYDYSPTSTDDEGAIKESPSKRRRYDRRNSKTSAMILAESSMNTSSILYHLDYIQDFKQSIQCKNTTNPKTASLIPITIAPQKQSVMPKTRIPLLNQSNGNTNSSKEEW